MLGVLLVVVAITATSCGGDDAERPPPTTTTKSEQRSGVVLLLDRDTARPGQTLELTVDNRTPARLEYGLAYRLERRAGDGWRWINRDAAFALILKIVGPGGREREEIRLPDDLRRGRYRIVKSFTVATSRRELRADVEFFVP